MNWKDVVVGAVATLVVTVLGGVGVYYVTKEPEDKKNERLSFVVSDPASFKGSAQDLSFRIIRLTNQGGVAAKNVVVSLNFKTTEIRDLSIEASAGIKESFRNKANRSIQIGYAGLLPNEAITLNLLLTSEENPTVDIRSDASMAKRGEIAEDQDLFNKKKFDKVANISGGIAAFVGMAGWIALRRRGYFRASNPNNSGFLLLHQGMIERADFIFDSTVKDGDHDALTLANFALCRAAQKDFEGADQLLRAAKFSGPNSGRIGAIVEFNDALIHLLKNDEAKAFELLGAAHKKAKDIKRYCDYSVFLNPVRTQQGYIDAVATKVD